MGFQITIDKQCLIIRENKKLKIIYKDINYIDNIKKVMNDFIKNKDKISLEEIEKFKNTIKSKYKDFFENNNYAINYNTAYEELGFPLHSEEKYCSKQEFIDAVNEYENAYILRNLYREYKQNSNIVAYSHRIRGFNKFSWNIDENFSFDLNTNFGYGSASYFEMVLFWKKIPIVNYLHIIFFRFAQINRISKVTKNYCLHPNEWKTCFEDTLGYVDSYYNKGKNSFVHKYLEAIFEELTLSLQFNMNTNLFSVLTDREIDYLFTTENLFSQNLIGQTIHSIDINKLKFDNVNNLLSSNYNETSDSYNIQDIFEYFIEDYKNFNHIKQKMSVYALMIFLMKEIEEKQSLELKKLFDDIYNSVKAKNNDEDSKFLYLINDEYDLQCKRSNQSELTYDSFQTLKGTALNYVWDKYKSKLNQTISLNIQQNDLLMNKFSLQINDLKLIISRQEKVIEEELINLKQKNSYKTTQFYKELFTILFDQMSDIFNIEENLSISIVYENLEKFKLSKDDLFKQYSGLNRQFNNLLKLDNFGLGKKSYDLSFKCDGGIKSYIINKTKLINEYVDKKNDTIKDILSSLVTVNKNIYELMMTLLFNKKFDIKEIFIDIMKDIKKISLYYDVKELNSYKLNELYRAYLKLYKTVFELNSLAYIENCEVYKEDSSTYNYLKNELKKLNEKLNDLNRKNKNLIEYNTMFKEYNYE